MGIFSKWFKRENVIDTSSIDDPLLKALIGDSAIDRNLALEMPVVSGSVDLICNTFAMIPFLSLPVTVTTALIFFLLSTYS